MSRISFQDRYFSIGYIFDDSKRYCYPRGSEQSIEYWNGYVADPQSTFGVVRNPLLQTFSSIQHYKCLVLLGEPGIGKSQVMRETAALMRSHTNSDDAYLEVNLGSYGQEGRLVEELFHCETYRSWAGGKNRLFLFLDSLDEGMLQIQVLCTLLTDKLRNADVSRLDIRIACRTGAFPKGFEETLSTLWGQKETQYFQLAPLIQCTGCCTLTQFR